MYREDIQIHFAVPLSGVTGTLWPKVSTIHVDSQQSCTPNDMYNDGQKDSVSFSTAAQIPIDSLWSSRFLVVTFALTQACDDSAYNVKVSLI